MLTAAHCIPSKAPLTYKGKKYYINVRLNADFPTYESMLTVYVGLHSQLKVVAYEMFGVNYLTNEVRSNVSYVLRVIKIFCLNQDFKLGFLF